MRWRVRGLFAAAMLLLGLGFVRAVADGPANPGALAAEPRPPVPGSPVPGSPVPGSAGPGDSAGARPVSATATPRPTATPQTIVSRIVRETPTPTPTPAPARTASARGGAALAPRVAVVDFGYSPAELRVRPGQSISFTNGGSNGHDVTGLGAEPWGSGPLYPGQTYSRVFSTVGTYAFYCTYHPQMRGRVTVEEAPAP